MADQAQQHHDADRSHIDANHFEGKQKNRQQQQVKDDRNFLARRSDKCAHANQCKKHSGYDGFDLTDFGTHFEIFLIDAVKVKE
ncbi:hypothetical protein [Rhodoferax sp.]|uniref:hypothetical protein n=1 Tax=Rhodoferax sp. TaxID=50421 RepID=UPI0025FBDF5D|nr:hypothetical protein [Rhodoferax sp.]